VKSEWQMRRDIVDVGRRIYGLNLVAATDGNISARLRGDRFLFTPAGSCLGELRPEELVFVDRTGRVLGARRHSPTSELPMHMEAYARRPDVGGIVHAHPPVATACSVAGISLEPPVLPEVVVNLGGIPTAEYATVSTAQGAAVIRDLIADHDAIILDRHGALTVGRDVYDAFRKLEKVEHCARVVQAAQQLGGVRTLPPEEVALLRSMRQ